MSILLTPMSKTLCRQYYKGFERDSDIYMDMNLFKAFVYTDSWADAYFERQASKQRLYFAIILDGLPIGEVILKDIDSDAKECSLSIHLQNNSVKGHGIGTQAERLALAYAFNELGMHAVNADTVLKNKRSQHVLEKVGFVFQCEEGIFRYYRCERENYLK